ncbi:MAG: TOBE domain-containing protein, partial [Stellaceae bacterium]
THDQEEAMTLADRIVVMRQGDIEQIGSPMEIYSNPVTDFVADFFGSPSMNLIPGEVQGEIRRRSFRSKHFSIPLPEPFAGVAPGPATLGIRPEHIHVRRGGADGADIDLPIRLVEPLGKDTLLYFDLGSERPFVVISEGLALAEMDAGDRVGLSLTRERLFLFGADGRRLARGAAFAAPVRGQLAATHE